MSDKAIKALDQPLADFLKKQRVHVEIVEKLEDVFPDDPVKQRFMGTYDWGRNTIFIPKRVLHSGQYIDTEAMLQRSQEEIEKDIAVSKVADSDR